MAKRKLTEKKILELRQRMIVHATVQKHRNPEDLAQDYVIGLLEGLHQKQTVGQAYIDICRRTSGRKGHSGYESRQTLNMLAVSDKQLDRALKQVDDRATLTQDELLDLQKAIGHIRNRRTLDIFMRRLNGWTVDEIGVHLELCEARVSQIIIKELKRLKEIVS